MGGVYIKNIFILFSFHNHFNLIASHTNSHSNMNTGLIANNNISNAIRGLMNNIIINNNNIIIRFSLILQQQQGIEPYTTLVHLITLTSCLVQLCQGTAPLLSTSSMDYTPLSLGLDLHQYSLAQGATSYYYLYQVLLYTSYVKCSLTYNK